jgi:diacylglycerol kinase family enzyme
VRPVHVFLNERSGGAVTAAAIEALFEQHGCACAVTLLRPKMDVGAAVRTVDAGTVVVAAGGDGTVNCVAAGALVSGAAMAVLPVGTLNHFAKDLGMPPSVAAAVAVIAAGHCAAVDAGQVNGRVFVNNSSLGFYPAMVTQRERLRQVGLNKWLSMTFVSLREFFRFRHITVRVCVDGVERTVRTPFFFVGNNGYTMHGPQMGRRKRLDGGRLYVYMAPGLTRWGLLRMTVGALRGRVREAPEFEMLCVTDLSVAFRRKTAWVSLDGEVRRMRGPLEYRIRPAALTVCVPAPAVATSCA